MLSVEWQSFLVSPLTSLPTYGKATAFQVLRCAALLQVGVGEGVVFLTYSSLTSSSDKGDTRLQQLVDWAGPDYDGLIIFDECHKAKNLIPEAGSKPTKVRPNAGCTTYIRSVVHLQACHGND